MKKVLMLCLFGCLLHVDLAAQSKYLKEYVRSFSLKESDTIIIDMQIPYEIIDWDKKIARTITQLESFSMPDEILRKLFRKGRYSVEGFRKDQKLRIFMPDVHHVIKVQGHQLTDEVVAQIYVPKDFPVKVVCNSRTPEEQLSDLWLQQEVLTRRMNYPIRKSINADFYADVKFKTGLIVAAQEVKGTKRFFELKVKAAGKEYNLVSRIGKLYDIKSLINRSVVFVEHDLAPELRNLTNEGMLIVQENDKGELDLITKEDIPDFLFVN